MTKDLEETLSELGAGYREVVERLRACEVAPRAPSRGRWRRLAPPAYLAAASVAAALLGSAWLFSARRGPAQGDARRAYTAAYERDGAALAAMLASQRADGSWANDFLTLQNAAALRAAGGKPSVAYKKAVRYLRSRGLNPLTEDELRLRAAAASSIAGNSRARY